MLLFGSELFQHTLPPNPLSYYTRYDCILQQLVHLYEKTVIFEESREVYVSKPSDGEEKTRRDSQIRQVFQRKLKSMAKTLDLDTENEYNMSYIVIDRLSIEGLI
jgi:hypothetical protein